MTQPKNLKGLLEQGIVSVALMPGRNDHLLNEKGKKLREESKETLAKANEFHHKMSAEEKATHYDLSLLDRLAGYTVPLIEHDYGASTPAMWNAAYEKLGLNIRNIMVVPTRVDAKESVLEEDVKTILEALKQDPKYLGGGAGVGFKIKAIQYLDSMEPADLKAINIIVKENGKLVGYNTDASGLASSIDEKLKEIGKKLQGSTGIVLGAGGVGQELMRELGKRGVSNLYIVNRTKEKAVKLAHEYNQKYGGGAEGMGEHLLRGAILNSFNKPDFVVNTTDKGSAKFPNVSAYAADTPDNETISRSTIRELAAHTPDIVHVDIVAQGSYTAALRQVDAAWERYGQPANIVTGKPMVIYQAVPAYKLVEKANSGVHTATLSEKELLDTMREAAKK